MDGSNHKTPIPRSLYIGLLVSCVYDTIRTGFLIYFLFEILSGKLEPVSNTYKFYKQLIMFAI
jgi:hypothetical protein